MGDYAKAEPLYQRALKIDEKALGPDHPDTAQTLNNLAELYRSMGDYAKAEPLYQRALKIKEKALGPDHPDTAMALNNLALLKIDLGEAKDAISFSHARATGGRKISIEYSFIHLRTTAPDISENNRPLHTICHVRKCCRTRADSCFGKKAWCSTHSLKIDW